MAVGVAGSTSDTKNPKRPETKYSKVGGVLKVLSAGCRWTLTNAIFLPPSCAEIPRFGCPVTTTYRVIGYQVLPVVYLVHDTTVDIAFSWAFGFES